MELAGGLLQLLGDDLQTHIPYVIAAAETLAVVNDNHHLLRLAARTHLGDLRFDLLDRDI